MTIPYLGDVAGKPGTIACGVCRNEAERQADGRIPDGWHVVTTPFDNGVMHGATFHFICADEEIPWECPLCEDTGWVWDETACGDPECCYPEYPCPNGCARDD